jgi:hypothetical protein
MSVDLTKRLAVEGASGFAKALAAITPGDDHAATFERAFAAVLHVRFAVERDVLHADAADAMPLQDGDAHRLSDRLASAPAGWMQRAKDAVHYPSRLNK